MSYIARAFAAGAVGAFGVVFGKSYYDAFNERQSLNRMEGERKTHEAELSTLAKSISSSKAAIESLEEQSKSAGCHMPPFPSPLPTPPHPKLLCSNRIALHHLPASLQHGTTNSPHSCPQALASACTET